MLNRILISAVILLSMAVSVQAGEWYYYNYDGTLIAPPICDSVVTVMLDSAYETSHGSKALALPVPGIQTDYPPIPQDLGYYQYRVVPGYDLNVLLDTLWNREDMVDFAEPAFQYSDTNIWNCYNELLVTFKESVSQSQIDSLISFYHLSTLRAPYDWYATYTFAQTEQSPKDIFQLSRDIFESGLCETSYPNIYGLMEPCSFPNDVYYEHQWNLNHASEFDGKVDADIDMPEAWQYAKGNRNVQIAIIDYAFDLDHVDIDDSRMWHKFDAGGDTTYLRLPDFDPRLPTGRARVHPYYWHGTACLGIIGAMTNNDLGVAGIANSVEIAPIKCIDDDLGGSFETFGMAFQWAEYWMMDVVVCPFKMKMGIPDIIKAIDYGYKYGGTATIVAAGNNSGPIDELAKLPTTFAVGGSDIYDNLWFRSSRGPGLDILAPSTGITTTDVTGELGYNNHNQDSDSCDMDLDYYCNFGSGRSDDGSSQYSGTSAAACEVGAVAALVKSRLIGVHPDSLCPELIYEVLRHSAEDQIHPDDPPGYDTLFGWGRLNAERALLAVVRGDANNDGICNITDAVYLITYIFGDGESPKPRTLTGDADGNGIVNISDAVYLIAWIFGGGNPPNVSFIYDY